MLYPKPTADEVRRLEALHALEVLDTPADPLLDELTQVAGRICGTPIALISLVDRNRQWFKSRVGLEASETPREVAFCAHAIHGREVFIVPDSQVDPRFADNPLVTGAPHVRFYAGAPLVVSEQVIGTLCVIDRIPHELTDDQEIALGALARAVVAHLELKRSARELAVARIEAERLAASRSRFVATMSHEIRTPMNGVLGALELLADEPLAPTARELADVARGSASRLVGLLDDVLDLSRLDAHAVTLEREPLDVAAELRAIVALMSPTARGAGVALVLDGASGGAERRLGDALRLHQIVTNLVANALKFTPAGEVRITLRAPHDDRIEITVADTGIGIPADTLATLFAPFRQAEAATARRYGGTGLGLAISHDLATLMGGTLSATSEPGRGSCFTLALPLPRVPDEPPPTADAQPQRDERAPTLQKAAVLAASSRHHVLVVDDEPVNRLVMQRLLERRGCTVTVACDGVEALARAAERRYDLILMDVTMPNVDGHEATRGIRAATGPNRTTPIIALTGNSIADEHAACAAAGMDDVLLKPLRREQLTAVLQRYSPTMR